MRKDNITLVPTIVLLCLDIPVKEAIKAPYHRQQPFMYLKHKKQPNLEGWKGYVKLLKVVIKTKVADQYDEGILLIITLIRAVQSEVCQK